MSRHRTLFWIAIVVAVGAAAAASYAGIPGSTGVISACVDGQGKLKVIDADAGQTCPASQKPLSWNQNGSGISGYQIVSVQSEISPAGVKDVVVPCPAGTKALGGGGDAFYSANGQTAPDMDVKIVRSRPAYAGNPGWVVRFVTTYASPGDWFVNAYATCAKA